MKKILSLLLVLSLLLSGCGGETTPEPETTAPAETVVATEKSPYDALPERMKLAVDLGILELSQLQDPDRVIPVSEASAMLQKAYVHRTGVESQVLQELINNPEYAERTAIRGWLAIVPAMADLELVYGNKYENYEQWQGFMATGFDKTEPLWYIFPYRLNTYSSRTATHLNMADESQVESLLEDHPLIRGLMVNRPRYGPLMDIYPYGFSVYDATNGKKFITADENGLFNPLGELTVEQVAESALCYYHYPNPMATPDFIAPEEMGSYNPEIITPALLGRGTDLPKASCQKLPSEWRGVAMSDMNWLGSDVHPDGNVYEYEIKAVKDAGFNFIALDVDFSWLQDYWLFGDKAETFAKQVDHRDKGKLSVERLEQLDQVLAWCMQYNVHLNLRATGVGYFDNSHQQNLSMLDGTAAGKRMAPLWKAIATRYKDIPNEYLSFTVLANRVFTYKNDVVEPSVRAIQSVSPERCLMMEVGDWSNKKPETVAKLGVALSYRVGEPYAALDHRDYYKTNHEARRAEFIGQEFVDNFTWPYEGMDGEKVMQTGLWGAPSIEKTIEVAEEYGVGFMVGNFGVYLENQGEDRVWSTRRYSDEAYEAMITDVLAAIEARDCGWCFGNWFGYFGVVNSFPAFENVVYEQLEDYPYYIDTAMLSWFLEWNDAR